MMDFAYRVFISYNEGDYDWAKKIYDELKEENYRPFLATEELRAGEQWQNDLFAALGESEHLLALCSSKSAVSSWVQVECGYFLRIIDEKKADRNRKIFPLMLDQDIPPLGSIQAITDIKRAGAYPGDAANVPPQIWRRVMEKIKATISIDFSAIPIGLIVLAMTQDRFKTLHANVAEIFSGELNKLLPHLRAKTVDEVMNHYGAEAKNWQPFGSTLDIESITQQVMNEVNQKVMGAKFRWEAISPEFYTDDQKLQRKALREMSVEAQAVVVDLLSLYDSQVRDQLGMLNKYFDDDKTAVMVLTPVVFDPYTELMDVIESRANEFFEHFYDAEIAARYAHCGMNVCDQRDMRRLLRATLGPHVPAPVERRSSGSGFLG